MLLFSIDPIMRIKNKCPCFVHISLFLSYLRK
jgi:hypothetical protein